MIFHIPREIFHFKLYIMQYIMSNQDISDIICSQKIVVWKNLNAQDGFLHPKDNLIGI